MMKHESARVRRGLVRHRLRTAFEPCIAPRVCGSYFIPMSCEASRPFSRRQKLNHSAQVDALYCESS